MASVAIEAFVYGNSDAMAAVEPSLTDFDIYIPRPSFDAEDAETVLGLGNLAAAFYVGPVRELSEGTVSGLTTITFVESFETLA